MTREHVRLRAVVRRGARSVLFTAAAGLIAAQLGAQNTTVVAHFANGSSSTTLPIQLASGKVHVQASFGDDEPVWLLLDSGANISILDLSLAERMGLELRGESTGQSAAGGGSFRFAFTRAPSMRLPGLRIDERAVAVIDRKTQGVNGHESLGLLGADLFHAFVVDIDYPNRTMTLHRPESFAYRGRGAILPVTYDANDKWQIRARVRVGSRELPAKLIVDTGSRGTIGFTSPFTADNALLEHLPAKLMSTVGFGVGGEVRHWVGRLDRIELITERQSSPAGGPVLEKLPVTFAPAEARGTYARADRDGILGAEILGQFRAIFDRPRNRLILEGSGAPQASIEWDASGLFLTTDRPGFDRVRVLSVAAATPAEAAGLSAGDIIVAIDGHNTTRLDEARAWLKVPNKRYRLTVERQGRGRFDIELTTRRLL